jgi:hypothetical protein
VLEAWFPEMLRVCGETLRGGTQCEVLRSLRQLSPEGIDVILVRPWLVLMRGLL